MLCGVLSAGCFFVLLRAAHVKRVKEKSGPNKHMNPMRLKWERERSHRENWVFGWAKNNRKRKALGTINHVCAFSSASSSSPPSSCTSCCWFSRSFSGSRSYVVSRKNIALHRHQSYLHRHKRETKCIAPYGEMRAERVIGNLHVMHRCRRVSTPVCEQTRVLWHWNHLLVQYTLAMNDGWLNLFLALLCQRWNYFRVNETRY